MERFVDQHEQLPSRVELMSDAICQKTFAALAENLSADFSSIPVETVGPDDLEFEFLETFTPVRNALVQSERQAEIGRLLNVYATNPENALAQLRTYAGEFSVERKRELPGFIYTVMGSKIIFPTFSPDRLLKLAELYAKKEGKDVEFTSEKDAKEFLEYLAEKYLYHEIGHVVYATMPSEIKSNWTRFISQREDILKRVHEVQSGNINDAMPFALQADEAFADTFVEIGSANEFNNRLGDFVLEKQQAEVALESMGFVIKNQQNIAA